MTDQQPRRRRRVRRPRRRLRGQEWAACSCSGNAQLDPREQARLTRSRLRADLSRDAGESRPAAFSSSASYTGPAASIPCAPSAPRAAFPARRARRISPASAVSDGSASTASGSRYVTRAMAPSVPGFCASRPSAGAGVVEQRPLGRQLPFCSNHCRTAGAGVGERLPDRHAAVPVEIGRADRRTP